MKKIWVSIDIDNVPQLVGTLWTHTRSATFEYHPDWISSPSCFSLQPGMDVNHTKVFTDRPLFGTFGDCAPDRWGRTLMQRANALNKPIRTLTEIDYLLQVSDESRQGALRFQEDPAGPFLSEKSKIPPLVTLPTLLAAADGFLSNREYTDELRMLLAGGSSVGGARAKAVVREGEKLMIAKFPQQTDDYNVEAWEHLALILAKKSGIQTPVFRLEKIGGRDVLLLDRFDREGSRRIPFISAMSLLDSEDWDTGRCYVEIADMIRAFGKISDLHQLWRRMIFNILVSNNDDHLRNNAFLRRGNVWELSPAYDLNPVPEHLKPRQLTTWISHDQPQSSLKAAIGVCHSFNLDERQAKKIAGEVAGVVSGWRREARRLSISSGDAEWMSSAFEHKDLEDALGTRKK